LLHESRPTILARDDRAMTAVGSSRFDPEEPAFARKKEKHKYGWIGVREKRLDQGACLIASERGLQVAEFRFPSSDLHPDSRFLGFWMKVVEQDWERMRPLLLLDVVGDELLQQRHRVARVISAQGKLKFVEHGANLPN
jgi:hypothetical protein